MSDAQELAERLRQFKEFQRGVKELAIPGCVSVALNLVTLARPEELTVGDLRESADLLEQQAETIRRLRNGLLALLRPFSLSGSEAAKREAALQAGILALLRETEE